MRNPRTASVIAQASALRRDLHILGAHKVDAQPIEDDAGRLLLGGHQSLLKLLPAR